MMTIKIVSELEYTRISPYLTHLSNKHPNNHKDHILKKNIRSRRRIVRARRTGRISGGQRRSTLRRRMKRKGRRRSIKRE